MEQDNKKKYRLELDMTELPRKCSTMVTWKRNDNGNWTVIFESTNKALLLNKAKAHYPGDDLDWIRSQIQIVEKEVK